MAMTYRELQDEVLGTRFSEINRPSIKRWINFRYAALWSMHPWPFKLQKNANASFVGGNSQVVSAADDIKRVHHLTDADGAKLAYISPDLFFERYPPADTATADPTEYTVWAETVYLGPTPQADGNLYITYERKFGHVGTSDVVNGNMENDNDSTYIPAEYDYILVPGSIALGLKIENDPTWEALEAEFRSMIGVMVEDYFPLGGEKSQYALMQDF